jgi:hypothetical protein
MKRLIVKLANQLIVSAGSDTAFTDYQRGYFSALNNLSVLISGQPLEPQTCSLEGCSNYFIKNPCGKPRKFCKNSHRVMAYRKRMAGD